MKAARNESCPCGSGRKYKHCCGRLAAGAAQAIAAAPGRATSPQEAAAPLEAADALRARGRVRESLPLYQRALALEPGDAVAHNNFGNAHLELGQCADAAAAYRRALAINPDHADIHCNLANALRQLGQLPEARIESERAVALNPQLSMAHNNLGLVLTGQGRRDEAVRSYRRALDLNPGYLEALNNLGNVLRELGERGEALSLYRKAIELDPQRADSHGNLGQVLLELGQLEPAMESFRRALALQPQHLQAHLGLGTALQMRARASEAQASYQAALALEPHNVEALTLLGELHANRGQFGPAQQLFQRALELDADFPFVYCSIAAHRKMTDEDGAWRQGVEALLGKPLPLGHQISLRYALGKYCDDVRRYDEAFAHYRAANELTKRYGASYQPQKLTERVERIIGRFDAPFLRQPHGETAAAELPVFIIGMPRSGTSLTEQILASHPAVFGAGELRFWNGAYGAFEAAQSKGESAASLLPAMAHDYLERLRTLSNGALRVVDKMPANFLYAGLIHAALPRARIIHMQRHPLDTCLSIYFQNFFNMGAYTNDLQQLAHYYGEYLRVTQHWRAVLPGSALLEIPYEGLIEDQEGWTRRLLEFVGLPWDARCLEFHRTERLVITASRWQVRQKLSAASVGRWRNYEKHLEPLRGLLSAAPQPIRVASSRPSSSA
jgi:tetratricopeptide (TPR) repeat protein